MAGKAERDGSGGGSVGCIGATRARSEDGDIGDRPLPYGVFSCLRVGNLDLGSWWSWGWVECLFLIKLIFRILQRED